MKKLPERIQFKNKKGEKFDMKLKEEAPHRRPNIRRTAMRAAMDKVMSRFEES